MTGSAQLAQHILDQLADIDGLVQRRFFGGWALRHVGRQVAIVMDTLYLRVEDADRSAMIAAGSRPFTYRAAGRTVIVHRYYTVPDDALDDREALRALLRQAIDAGRASA
jgi:DNA transformation protein